MTNVDTRSESTKLHVRDLTSVMAACTGEDPGPDPTWYPDKWPTEPTDPTEPGVRITGIDAGGCTP